MNKSKLNKFILGWLTLTMIGYVLIFFAGLPKYIELAGQLSYMIIGGLISLAILNINTQD